MTTITIDEACAKYGLERKALIGRCLRDLLEDPLVIDCTGNNYLLADDWRLKKMANPRVPDKSGG